MGATFGAVGRILAWCGLVAGSHRRSGATRLECRGQPQKARDRRAAGAMSASGWARWGRAAATASATSGWVMAASTRKRPPQSHWSGSRPKTRWIRSAHDIRAGRGGAVGTPVVGGLGGTGRMARRIEEALERQPKNRIWCDFGGGINAQHRLAGHSPAVGRAISACDATRADAALRGPGADPRPRSPLEATAPPACRRQTGGGRSANTSRRSRRRGRPPHSRSCTRRSGSHRGCRIRRAGGTEPREA